MLTAAVGDRVGEPADSGEDDRLERGQLLEPAADDIPPDHRSSTLETGLEQAAQVLVLLGLGLSPEHGVGLVEHGLRSLVPPG